MVSVGGTNQLEPQDTFDQPADDLDYWFHLADGRPACIRLDKGEPDLQPHSQILDAAIALIRSGQVKYSSGLRRLREAIADRIRVRNGIVYNPLSEIWITHGAIGALFACGLYFARRGLRIGIPDVGWPTVAGILRETGAEFLEYPFLCNTMGDKSSLSHTQALIINSPHNPTGRVLSHSDVEGLVKLATSYDLIVVSDETYEDLTFPGFTHLSPAGFPGMRERTIVINSFSKSYCMTGWRVGFIAGPEQLVSNIGRLSLLSTGGISLISQAAALAALEVPAEYLREMAGIYHNRAKIACGIVNNSPYLQLAEPQGTFYAFIDIRRCTTRSTLFARRLLESYDVAVVPGVVFGTAGEGYIRLSLTLPDQQLEQALNRLVACAAELKSGERES